MRCSLIKNFGCKCQFCNNVLLCWVAVEGIVFYRDLKAVIGLYINPIVLNVQTVVLNGQALCAVVLTAIVTCQNKAVFFVVGDLAGADVVEFPTTGLCVNVYVVGEGIFTAFDLCLYLFAFPQIPIGNVWEFGIALGGFQFTVFAKLPFFAARGAKDVCAFRSHCFLKAMRALVKNLVESFCAEGLSDEDIVFFLIFVFVILQSVFEVIVDLCHAHLFDLLRGEC